MDRESERMKIKQILTATIVSLCNNSLMFDGEMTVEGLLGITLDRKDVILVNIKETVGHHSQQSGQSQKTPVPPVHQNSVMTLPGGHMQNVKMEQLPPQHCSTQPPQCTALQAYTTPSAGYIEKSMPTPGGGVMTQKVEWSSDVTQRTVPKVQSMSTFAPATASVQQTSVKLEPGTEYSMSSDSYYTGDGDTGYDTYYDQGGGGGDQFTSAVYSEDSASQGFSAQPQFHTLTAKKKMRMTPSKKSASKQAATANTARPPSKPPASSTSSGSSGKDVNNSLIQRALDLVHEGQLTAGVAIKLFGIPRSTFYKKLSMCNPKQQAQDECSDQYYTADGLQTEYGTDDFVAGTDSDLMGVGEWAGTEMNYADYYAS